MRTLLSLLAILACFALLSWHDAYTEARIAEHDRAAPAVRYECEPVIYRPQPARRVVS